MYGISKNYPSLVRMVLVVFLGSDDQWFARVVSGIEQLAFNQLFVDGHDLLLLLLLVCLLKSKCCHFGKGLFDYIRVVVAASGGSSGADRV